MPGVGDGTGDNGLCACVRARAWVCVLGTQSLTADMRLGDELSAYRPGCRGNPKFKVKEKRLDLAGLAVVRERRRPQVGVFDVFRTWH